MGNRPVIFADPFGSMWDGFVQGRELQFRERETMLAERKQAMDEYRHFVFDPQQRLEAEQRQFQRQLALRGAGRSGGRAGSGASNGEQTFRTFPQMGGSGRAQNPAQRLAFPSRIPSLTGGLSAGGSGFQPRRFRPLEESG